MTHDPAPLLCGTRAGYIRHIRAGETACEECRAAHTLYVRLWRARTASATDTARSRALRRLAQLHPIDYRQLYKQERQKVRQQKGS